MIRSLTGYLATRFGRFSSVRSVERAVKESGGVFSPNVYHQLEWSIHNAGVGGSSPPIATNSKASCELVYLDEFMVLPLWDLTVR